MAKHQMSFKWMTNEWLRHCNANGPLEDYIETFPGAVFSVSHETVYFHCTRRQKNCFIFEEKVKVNSFYFGILTDYIEEEEDEKKLKYRKKKIFLKKRLIKMGILLQKLSEKE